MRKGVFYYLCWLLMLGTFITLVPALAEAAPSSSLATPVVEAVPSVTGGPFTVLWTQKNSAGWAIPMRLGRDRSKPALWGDGYDNFGLVHIHKGHVGHGKDWASDVVMVAQVRRALEKPSGIFPDQYTPYFSHYVLCDEYGALGLRVRVTVEVVIDTRVLPDRLPVGIKTAWQKIEFF
jgi:hypothetical protein